MALCDVYGGENDGDGGGQVTECALGYSPVQSLLFGVFQMYCCTGSRILRLEQ